MQEVSVNMTIYRAIYLAQTNLFITDSVFKNITSNGVISHSYYLFMLFIFDVHQFSVEDTSTQLEIWNSTIEYISAVDVILVGKGYLFLFALITIINQYIKAQ